MTLKPQQNQSQLSISATAVINIDAAADGSAAASLPKFRMVAYTGGPMRVAGWRYPVIIDLAGLSIPSQARPIRFGHDPLSGVGHTDAIRVDQSNLERIILDRILAAWLDEAALLPGLLPDGLGPFAQWPHQWFWDGQEHVDPAKEANAQATRLASHTTTLADEYAKRGQDWETQLRQRAKEIALMSQLGLATESVTPATNQDDADVQDEEVPADDA